LHGLVVVTADGERQREQDQTESFHAAPLLRLVRGRNGPNPPSAPAERARDTPNFGKLQDSKRPRSDIGGLRNRTAAGGATRRPAPGALGSVDDARNSGGRRRPAPRRRKISRPPARSRVRAVPDGSSPPRRRGPSGPDSSAGCGSSGPRGPRSA